MLLEKSESKPGLPGYYSFGRPLHPSDQPEEGRLAASISTDDSPTISAPNGEGYPAKDCRSAKLDTDIGNRNLGQERNTLEQAARQRSIVSTVWSPIWPIRKVELFSFPYPLPTTIPRFPTAAVNVSAARSEGSLIADTVGDWEPRGAMFASFLPVSSLIFATQSWVRAAIAL